jgi:sortase A
MVFAVTTELAEYPWFAKTDASELPDPSPPAFEVIRFEALIDRYSPIGIQVEPPNELPPGLPLNAISPPRLNVMTGDMTEYIFGDETEDEPEPEVTPEIIKYVWLGSVKIPRINVSENLFMGTGSQLNHGIGHLVGTPIPGGAGNVVISAHRTSSRGMQPFRHLNLLSSGDVISINISETIYTYEVFDSFIVSEDDLWVLWPMEEESFLLTLITCDPVITARATNRLIVRARLMG